MACVWSRFTTVTMGPLAVAAAQLLPCPAYAQKAISGDGIAQIDLRQPASFSTYTVTGDPASTEVTFIGSAFVADTDAVTDGGSARSYVFRNRGTIRTSGTKSAGVLLGSADAGSTVVNTGLVESDSTGDGIRIRGMAGVRVDGRKIQPYATLNWWHAGIDSNISFNRLPLGSLYPSNRYEFKLGVNADIGKRWSGWANVAGAWGAQSFYQYALRAGVKYAW